MSRKFVAALGAIVLLWLPNTAQSQDYSFKYERNVEAIVEVNTFTNTPGVGLGTGFFIADRFIVTADHVLGEEPFKNYITVNGNDYPEMKIPVDVIFSDKETDVAVLEISKDYWNDFKNLENPVNVKFSDMKVIPGQEIWGIGNRNGFLFQFYSGHISMADFPDFETKMNVHIIESEIFQGDSGGPLFDKNGYVIGLARSIFNPGAAYAPPPEEEEAPKKEKKQEKTRGGYALHTDNMEFFVSKEVIRKSLKDMVDHGRQPFHPAFHKDIKLLIDHTDGRVFIEELKDYNTFFKKAGLQIGDRKLVINGKVVKDPDELPRIFSMIAYNELVKFEWERKGVKMFGEAIYTR